MTTPRVLARQIFDAGVAAADPTAAVQRHIGQINTKPALIIAVGKAAINMARPAIAVFPTADCIVVTNDENAQDIDGQTVWAASHPVPDARGVDAAQAVIRAVQAATGPILMLVSGGGSALLPAPAAGISLEDKILVNTTLLSSGLNINQMNMIRQQLSRLKGGGLLRLTGQPVTALILSDVIGDDLSAIASGLTAPPIGTPNTARDTLQSIGVWGDLPPAVTAHLDRAVDVQHTPSANNILIGSNGQSVRAMQAVCRGAVMLPTPIEGDVADAARLICDQAANGVTLWGGETTVQISGTGKGGRNQDLALRIACEAKQRGWGQFTCLAGGSDGRDGPVDAAGGLVDDGTLARVAAAGGDIQGLLANNDSYHALQLASDLLMTGPTGTNVADLGVLIR